MLAAQGSYILTVILPQVNCRPVSLSSGAGQARMPGFPPVFNYFNFFVGCSGRRCLETCRSVCDRLYFTGRVGFKLACVVDIKYILKVGDSPGQVLATI